MDEFPQGFFDTSDLKTTRSGRRLKGDLTQRTRMGMEETVSDDEEAMS